MSIKLLAGIPTQGARPSLLPLVEVVAAEIGSANVIIGLNSLDRSGAKTLSLLTGSVVAESPPGYSSSRNSLIDRALSEGATHLLLIDDDVVLDPAGLQGWIAEIHRNRNSIVGLRVTRRPEQPSKLFDAVFNPFSGREPYAHDVPSLPATCLCIPLTQLSNKIHFPLALDHTGGEDTAFTWQARERGIALLMHELPGTYEVHTADRMVAHQLLSRVLANTVVLGLLRRSIDFDACRWIELPLGRLGMFSALHALALVARFSPKASVQLTKAAGRLLVACRWLPVRSNSSWTLRYGHEHIR